MTSKKVLSVVVPVFNEKGSLAELYRRLLPVLTKFKSYEILFIDDGSTDGSIDVLRDIVKKNKDVKVVRFMRNCGQTAALSAGFDYAIGEMIVTIDADLQNDPNDIPKLIKKMGEGFDVVSGWRQNRHEEYLWTRRIPSILANSVISFLVGFTLHDYGCTLKAYRSEIVKPMRLYGEMHRFIPAYAHWYGARIAEIPVSYHSRKFGKSKYNLSRFYKVILDLFTLKFLETYITKPIYVFGMLGFTSFAGGFLSVILLVYNKFINGVSMIQSPVLLLSALFVILGVMFISMGLLAEISVRTYHESQSKKTYLVKEIF